MNKNEKSYGLLSLMALIIGTVVGSAIFIKNSQLVSENGSILLTIISWVIGSLIVIAMIIAFIEIFTVTQIKDEQSNLGNIGKHLIGVRFGKTMSYYIALIYFPMMIASLFYFGADQIITTLIAAGVSGDFFYKDSFKNYEIIIIILAFVLMTGFCLMNSFTVKPGKVWQLIGTSLKLIPLLFIISLLIALPIAGDWNGFNQDTSDQINSVNKGLNPLVLVLLTLPSILFSFDGFLIAGALSKEAKSQRAFNLAFLLSNLFIVVLYILFSMAIFTVGDVDLPNYGTIDNAIKSVFSGTTAVVLSTMTNAIVVIAILTTASGLIVSSSRILSDMSANNMIRDEKGRLIVRNKSGASWQAGMSIFLMSLIWFVAYAVLDSVVVSQGGGPLRITLFVVDMLTIFMFFGYGLIIGGGIMNRFKPKVEVKKNKMFLPASITVFIFIFFLTAWFSFTVLAPYEYIFGSTVDKTYWITYIEKMVLFVVWIIIFVVVTIINIRRTESLSKETIAKKKKLVKEYYK